MKQVTLIFVLLVLLVCGTEWFVPTSVIAAPSERGHLQGPTPTPEPCVSNQPFGGCFGLNGLYELSIYENRKLVSTRRLDKAAPLGTTWSRTVLFWYDIEQFNDDLRSPPGDPDKVGICHGTEIIVGQRPSVENWQWCHYDEAIEKNNAYGVKSLFVLQGVPERLRIEGELSIENSENSATAKIRVQVPIGLKEPIFGTKIAPHIPIDDKIAMELIKSKHIEALAINPNNPWADFVYQTVYHLHGELGNNQAIYLQLWNEPMTWAVPPVLTGGIIHPYWEGTNEQYARLVEVAYWAVQLASTENPSIEVKLGMPGLADEQADVSPGIKANYQGLLIDLSKRSTNEEKYLDFFDFFATHDYNNPLRILKYPQNVRDFLISKGYPAQNIPPFWITEFGAKTGFVESPTFGGPEEEARASLSLQSAIYLLALREEARIDKFFFFSLNNAADDTGLLRNGADQFPDYHHDLEERQAYFAMLQFKQYLAYATPGYNGVSLYDTTPDNLSNPPENCTAGDCTKAATHQEVYFTGQTIIPNSAPDYEKITALWNMDTQTVATVRIKAIHADRSAKLVWQDGFAEILQPTNGEYKISLPPAPPKGPLPTDENGNERLPTHEEVLSRNVSWGGANVGGRTAFLLEGGASETPHVCAAFDDLPLGFNKGVQCGLQLIRDTLVNSGITFTDEEWAQILKDPPVPGMVFDNAPNPNPSSLSWSWQLENQPATQNSNSNLQSWLSEHTLLSGQFTARWQSSAWVGTSFNRLQIASAQVYDAQNQLLGTGAVTVDGSQQTVDASTSYPLPSTVVVMGNQVSYQVTGQGDMAFYAPAVEGLGVAGQWLTQTTTIRSQTQYGLGIEQGRLTLNGRTYTGTFVLLTSQPTTIQGQGYFRSPNFADSLSLETAGTASLHLSAPTPSALLITQNSLLTISQHSPTLDQIELTGVVARDLSLALIPPTSRIMVTQTTTFTPQINSNQSDSYTLTITPPAGWQAEVDGITGQVIIHPSAQTTAGDYPIQVSLRPSAQFTPSVVLPAVHTVTILPQLDFALAAALDPLTTVPWGSPEAGSEGSINNGQLQVPAAYIATLTNTLPPLMQGGTGGVFNLQIIPHGFPTDWVMLGGVGRQPTTTLTLAAGDVGQLGVYLAPPTTSGAWPAAGTVYPFDIQATVQGLPTMTHQIPLTFVMPALPFNRLAALPSIVYVAPNMTGTLAIVVQNVGNAAGSFPLAVTLPQTRWLHSEITGTLVLTPALIQGGTGGVEVQRLVFTATGAKVGDKGRIRVRSAAPATAYAQVVYVDVEVASPCVADIYQLRRLAEQLADEGLRVRADNLASQLQRWEAAPTQAVYQQRTLSALSEVINYLQ